MILPEYACCSISKDEHGGLFMRDQEIGEILGKMMGEPEKWCTRKSLP
jgi:hypothetical protein